MVVGARFDVLRDDLRGVVARRLGDGLCDPPDDPENDVFREEQDARHAEHPAHRFFIHDPRL